MSSEIFVDTDRCQGHGRCALLSPEVFSVDEYGKAYVLATDAAVLEAHTDAIDEAIMSCPESALKRS